MTEITQGIFNFETGNTNGIENFRKEQGAIKEKIRQEWSLPLGKPVRIRLFGFDETIEGVLKLVRNPTVINHKHPVQLHINKTEFLSTDIEQCTVL